MSIGKTVWRVKYGVIGMLLVMGMASVAEPTVTVGEVKTGEPWSKVTVNYTLGGTDTKLEYKVAFDMMAGGQTASVTNDAAKLTDGAATQVIDTAALFGKQVSDTKAKVRVSLIAVKPKMPGVQLWAGGPFFAECNLGARKPEDYGWYFWWGDTVGYTNSGSAWLSVVDDTKSIKFWQTDETANQTYDKDIVSLRSEGWIDAKNELKPEHDAATRWLGAPWRMMTYDEWLKLSDDRVCKREWKEKHNGTDKNGWLITGVTDGYTDKSIFLPAAGYGQYSDLKSAGRNGSYWMPSPVDYDSKNAWFLNFGSSDFDRIYNYRDYGMSVRAVR